MSLFNLNVLKMLRILIPLLMGFVSSVFADVIAEEDLINAIGNNSNEINSNGNNNSSNSLKYWEFTTPQHQVVHVLEIDPSQFKIQLAHAKDKVLAVETVSNIAARKNALAGINGGFFKMGPHQDGIPAGILKINDHWFGIAYRSRAAMGWSDKTGESLIDRVQTKTTLLINHTKYPVYKLNYPAMINKAILYTPAYGNEVVTHPGGVDVIIQDNKIIDMKSSGKTEIPSNGYVYSIGPKAKLPPQNLRIGDSIKLDIAVLPHFQKETESAWNSFENIVGGAPLLIKDGAVIFNYLVEGLPLSFINKQHARTAVGRRQDGHWLFVVVEKSIVTGSIGMTLAELANTMAKLGCVDALNLDGGGSSTLYVQNKIVNHPQGEIDEHTALPMVRKISDALLVVAK